MKRLLSIIHTPVFGGPHNQMLRLTAPLRDLGWDTTVLMPDDEDSTGAKRLENAGLDVVRIPLHRLRAKPNLQYHADFLSGLGPEIRQIRDLICELKIDLVQICGLMNPHGAIAAKLAGVPVVWQLLGTTAPAPLRWLLMPLVLRLANVIMATGEATANAHPGAYTLKERLVLFSPPVDSRIFFPDQEAKQHARSTLNCAETDIVIGTVGNQNKLKGHEYMVSATALVRRRYPHVVTRVLGGKTTHSSYYQRNVIALARNLDLLDDRQLMFYDPGNAVPYFLPALDIFLLTSHVEGMPTVVLEAMSCGIPVVSFDVGSTKEIVQDGVTGFIVPYRDSAALLERIIQLIDDNGLRTKMGIQGRESVQQNYDISVCARTHEHAYELALKHHRDY